MASRGLEYLKTMGVRSVKDLEEEIYRIYGGERGRHCVEVLDGLFTLSEERILQNDGSDPLVARQSEMVQFVNQSYELSILFASFYDWDVMRRICRSLEALFPLFGSTILDVGCGNGILTGFVAASLPCSKVYGVDIVLEDPPVWKEIIFRAGVSNLSFCRSLEREAAKETVPERFDTVLSIRSFHENVSHPPCHNVIGTVWEDRRRDCRSHAAYLASKVSPGGKIFLLDRKGEPGYWEDVLFALEGEGFLPIPETKVRFCCREGEDTSTFFGLGFGRR